MELCTNLQNRVLDLEKTKTTQQNEIASLKRRVKKLEQKKRSRTHRLKRLRKVGATTRVESSRDEEILGEDASKHGRIDSMDADDNITLVSDHFVDVLDSKEVFVSTASEKVSAASEKFSTASAAITVSATTTTTTEDITLAQALQEMKTTKPKMKGVVIQEPSEFTKKISSQLSSQLPHDKGKGIWVKPVKPLKMKDQAKIDADHQLAERQQAQEQEELCVEEKAALFQQLLEKRRKHFAAKRTEEKRSKPPTKTQQRKIIAFRRVNTFEDFRIELVEGKENRAEEELEQEVAKKQKMDDEKETAELKELMEIDPEPKEVAIDAIPLAVKPPKIVD
ncbi:hypothetical protein Tco_0815227 [Tanacetum coccineum]